MREDSRTRERIERSSHGDVAAKDVLLSENLPNLIAFIRLHAGPVVRAHESCADVAQSVCREVLESELDGFEYRGASAFRRWLFTRALNKLNNRRRYYLAVKRDARRTGPLSRPELFSGVAALYATLGSPSQNAIQAETVERLEAAFDQLSERDKEIISMARIHLMSHAEIAATLGRNENAVRVQLKRALARLGTIMHLARDRPDRRDG